LSAVGLPRKPILNSKGVNILIDLSSVSRALKDKYEDQVPGMIFCVLKDGELFEAAQFGKAREPDSPESWLEMNARNMMHGASVAKLLCAVAVLKLIEVWNQIYDGVNPSVTIDVDRVNSFGKKISLDTKIYDLVGQYLMPSVFGIAPSNYPGKNVNKITIGHLINHDSGLGFAPRGVYGNYNGISKEQFDNELYVEGGTSDGGKSFFDAQLATTNLFVADSVPLPIHDYRGENSIPLSFLIEIYTGMTNGDWMKEFVLPRSDFSNIDRIPNSKNTLVRYYSGPRRRSEVVGGPMNNFDVYFDGGTLHPDYSSFPCVGGWYYSSIEVCHWLDAVMQGKLIGGTKILNDPDLLFDLKGAFQFESYSGFNGFAKNGGTTVHGGSCNAKLGYFKKDGSRFTVFMANNGSLGIEEPWDDAMKAADDFFRNATVLPVGRPMFDENTVYGPTIYELANGSGQSQELVENRSPFSVLENGDHITEVFQLNLSDLSIGNDKVSSLIPLDFEVTLYEHENFGGQSLSIAANTPLTNLSDFPFGNGESWSGKVSSIELKRTRTALRPN
jgi:CubicO group peptidase (beta-lactamase class C family)